MNKKELDIDSKERYIVLFEKYHLFLTQNQRQVFQLKYFEDLSYQEVSEILATTRAAAQDALKKALKKLNAIDKKM